MEADTPTAAISPPTNVGLRSRPRSNIGDFSSSWVTTKATSRTPEATKLETTRLLPQPSTPPRIRASTSRPSPALNVTKPSQSGRPAYGLRLSSTLPRVTARARTQMGMFTQKIQCQDRPLVRTPPSTGPTATATPVVAPKNAKAVPRSLPLKAPDSSARAVANMIAPPTP